jgi:hypothetical protein
MPWDFQMVKNWVKKVRQKHACHILETWGAKSQIGTNFEICVSKFSIFKLFWFSNYTNFESSHKFIYRKIGINNYIDMTKFENDADIRYQIFNFMYNSKFLPDKHMSDILLK